MADDDIDNIGSDGHKSDLEKPRSTAKTRQRTSDSSAKTGTGKPKKSETRRRTKCLPVRLTPAEHSFLKEVAGASGLKMGAYIRQKVLGDAGKRAQRAPSPDKESLATILGQLGKLGGNVNQLAKRANTDGFDAVTEKEFAEMRAHIAAMRAMLMVTLGPNGH